ncbi:MAG: glycosyltransferase family 2 protein [Gemmatimonadetes bacterium]|nr:glycosyltransferase family 2 protein [Gemmatimonadota bacterium]
MYLKDVGILLALLPGLLFGYAYLVYPALLKVWGALRPDPPRLADPAEWPLISIVVPAYNEEHAIRRTIEALLGLDYPVDRRQILIVSDASTDGTDDVVREYAHRGVELLRLPERSGKTAAENAALPHLRGGIVVNTDATIRILPTALKPLIRVFQDPAIGVASGRDVSVGALTLEANQGESGYVGYEMWVRSLETRVGSIVGASGCFYAIRLELHETLVPAALSRDFASALTAREHGYRAVSVDEAVCLVPRTSSLQREYHRKVRTMARGLETLWFKRHLLNPFRHGRFAWMLWSHKLIRWLVFLVAPVALLALGALAIYYPVARVALGLALTGVGLGIVALQSPEGRRLPRPVALCGFVLATHLAGFLAWTRALRGELNPIWEPTRRPV